MARSPVRVRPATVDDLPALLALGEELRDQLLAAGDAAAGRGRGGPAVRAALAQRYRDAIEDPDRAVVLAVDEAGEPLGAALLTVAIANPLLDLRAVHLSHAVVADRHRRRGAGRALVAAAAAYAEERGLDQLIVSVHPGSRESNRFFARLGFAPVAVRRLAPVAVVRRRLASQELRSADHVVRRRPRRLGRTLGSAAEPDPSPEDAPLG